MSNNTGMEHHVNRNNPYDPGSFNREARSAQRSAEQRTNAYAGNVGHDTYPFDGYLIPRHAQPEHMSAGLDNSQQFISNPQTPLSECNRKSSEFTDGSQQSTARGDKSERTIRSMFKYAIFRWVD
jgi:hypothetical protein